MFQLNRHKETMEQKYKLKVLETKEAVKKIDSDYAHKVIQFLNNI